MLRHVFIINVKKGIPDDIVEQKMAEMRAMKEKGNGNRRHHGRPHARIVRTTRCRDDGYRLERQGGFRYTAPQPDAHRHCGKSRRGFRYAECRHCPNRILTLKTD